MGNAVRLVVGNALGNAIGNAAGNAVGNDAENARGNAVGKAVGDAVGNGKATGDDEIVFIVLSIISKTCRTWFHKTVCSLWILLDHACTTSSL